ncbi:MAG: methylhydantoinase [Pseudomonadota bacterium]|nr:MAG: methylhydantoinase [Pseudomonadota bacterium]
MVWTVGVDVGGTFTDFFAVDESSGSVHVGKFPSTPGNPAEAVLNGLEVLAQEHGLNLNELRHFSHGTTVATNALLQRRGGDVMLLTTAGFADLLDIGRQTRPHMFDLFEDYPTALVPRSRRIEVSERITDGGEILIPLKQNEIERVVDCVRAANPQSCAVCFLFAFQNPEHERAVTDELRRSLPEIEVCASSEVQPEFREFERFSTTVLNAYLQPVMAQYMTELDNGLKSMVPNASFGLNQSSGGLMSVGRAQRLPVRTALSGPAAGVVGAAYVAGAAQRPNAITLDMGGTSADVALIRQARIPTVFSREVGGFPIRMPMVDVETVGAGGGSVAWVDRDGLLKVGPKSMGANPGPACYGLGGTQPTVTDANLILGRLSEDGLLAGTMNLDKAAAATVFDSLAQSLDVSPLRAAKGVIDIVVANMVRAIRTISVERGHDPRGYCLMPFGGAGPLHARDVARNLGIQEILVPPAPGIICAHGLVVSDLLEDFVDSGRIAVNAENVTKIEQILNSLSAQARNWFEQESILDHTRAIRIRLDMRYVGQNFELAVPLETPGNQIPALMVGDLQQKFFSTQKTTMAISTQTIPSRLSISVSQPAVDSPHLQIIANWTHQIRHQCLVANGRWSSAQTNP